MRPSLSQEFVFSFLESCFEAGLSKEAAAELLQKESADQELRRRPAFAEGYRSVTAQIPGQMLPLRAGYEGLEKAAVGPVSKGFGTLAKSLWGVPKGLWEIGSGTLSGASKGVKAVRDSSFLKNHPFAALLAGSTATGAGVLGVNHWWNRDRRLTPTRPTPFFSPSGYSPAAYDERYKKELDSYAPGIYEHNKSYFGTEARRKELEKAIAEGKDVGGQATLELQTLNRQHAADDLKRRRHVESLDTYQNENRQLVDRIADRVSDLENQRTAWWAAPKRWALSATGHKPQEYFDTKISDLQSSRSQAQMEADLAADRLKYLWSGATAEQAKKPPSSQDLQQKFFSSY